MCVLQVPFPYVGRKPVRRLSSEPTKEMEVAGKKQEILNSGHQRGKSTCTCVSWFNMFHRKKKKKENVREETFIVSFFNFCPEAVQ